MLAAPAPGPHRAIKLLAARRGRTLIVPGSLYRLKAWPTAWAQPVLAPAAWQNLPSRRSPCQRASRQRFPAATCPHAAGPCGAAAGAQVQAPWCAGGGGGAAAGGASAPVALLPLPPAWHASTRCRSRKSAPCSSCCISGAAAAAGQPRGGGRRLLPLLLGPCPVPASTCITAWVRATSAAGWFCCRLLQQQKRPAAVVARCQPVIQVLAGAERGQRSGAAAHICSAAVVLPPGWKSQQWRQRRGRRRGLLSTPACAGARSCLARVHQQQHPDRCAHLAGGGVGPSQHHQLRQRCVADQDSLMLQMVVQQAQTPLPASRAPHTACGGGAAAAGGHAAAAPA